MKPWRASILLELLLALALASLLFESLLQTYLLVLRLQNQVQARLGMAQQGRALSQWFVDALADPATATWFPLLSALQPSVTAEWPKRVYRFPERLPVGFQWPSRVTQQRLRGSDAMAIAHLQVHRLTFDINQADFSPRLPFAWRVHPGQRVWLSDGQRVVSLWFTPMALRAALTAFELNSPGLAVFGNASSAPMALLIYYHRYDYLYVGNTKRSDRVGQAIPALFYQSADRPWQEMFAEVADLKLTLTTVQWAQSACQRSAMQTLWADCLLKLPDQATRQQVQFFHFMRWQPGQAAFFQQSWPVYAVLCQHG